MDKYFIVRKHDLGYYGAEDGITKEELFNYLVEPSLGSLIYEESLVVIRGNFVPLRIVADI